MLFPVNAILMPLMTWNWLSMHSRPCSLLQQSARLYGVLKEPNTIAGSQCLESLSSKSSHMGEHESTSQSRAKGYVFSSSCIADLPQANLFISVESIAPCYQLMILNTMPRLMHSFIQQVPACRQRFSWTWEQYATA